jgi:hypothetical protein
MKQNSLGQLLPENDDRRKNRQLRPPYITEEGFVLIDRRTVESDGYESRGPSPDPLDVITIMAPA